MNEREFHIVLNGLSEDSLDMLDCSYPALKWLMTRRYDESADYDSLLRMNFSYEEDSKPLLEMSFELNKVLSHISACYAAVKDNIIKLHFWGRTDTKNHWKQELYDAFYEVDLIKKKNGKDKPPTQTQIYESLWGRNSDAFEKKAKAYIRNVFAREGKPLPSIQQEDIDAIRDLLDRYCRWASNAVLNEELVIDRDMAYAFMDELFQTGEESNGDRA